VGIYLFAKPLLSNGICVFAYLAVVVQRQVYILQILNNNKFGKQAHAEESKAKSRNVLCRPTNYEHTDTAPYRQDWIVHPPRCWSLHLAPRRLAGCGGLFQWLCYHQHSTHPHWSTKLSPLLKEGVSQRHYKMSASKFPVSKIKWWFISDVRLNIIFHV
jgi:hypothetical protein